MEFTGYNVSALHKFAVVAPAGDGQVAALYPLPDPAIIVSPHRVAGALEIGGVGGAVGKQVNYLHGTKTPGPGKGHAATNCWVIFLMVGSGGVQSNEQNPAIRGRPLSLETITIAATARKACFL